MSETAERTTHRCSERHAGATNRLSRVAQDAGIVCEKPPNTNDALMLVVAMIVIAIALRPGIASIGPVLPLISRAFSLWNLCKSPGVAVGLGYPGNRRIQGVK
jgi:MFS transporter, CP family, cyanate transporter